MTRIRSGQCIVHVAYVCGKTRPTIAVVVRPSRAAIAVRGAVLMSRPQLSGLAIFFMRRLHRIT